ncbi:hypothetical protein Pen02_70740 [Plantactinospora endophytica]|uniref:Uncharacterized protein n=1 Tax=Plantactinospora endophytica TaxID=673535 RepID=A0ABQ4EBM5_9ACTN|nr:hypothetical protein Pen02_70740 [Plantactinospora endophytica]
MALDDIVAAMPGLDLVRDVPQELEAHERLLRFVRTSAGAVPKRDVADSRRAGPPSAPNPTVRITDKLY